jgi:valyl-tRNA synthetase
VRLWDRGWIYEADRIVNWCPHHRTAISDLEVEHVEVDDALTYVRYPFVDGNGHVTVATARPSTILADMAVAVHPDDPRYAGAIGREVVVPVVGRVVPVIADARVEPEFGTGALKVTPGHDPKDFDIGRDAGLIGRGGPPAPITAIGLDGHMAYGIVEGYDGLTQEEAEQKIVGWLREHDQLEKRESYHHSVGTCERCHARIEPLVTKQWWCEMKGLGAPAIEALEARTVRFHPESQHRFAIDSLETAPDWCLSRQLWWGHQLPIWRCPDGHVTVAWPPPERCGDCGTALGPEQRSQDVLDTWFSSALWPIATLGWPAETPELDRYYPGNVNVTAREIIRLWENRMIFTGLFLADEIPFTDVIITSTVLAADGRRMSKSLGTGIDPLEAVDRHGADATRYGLLKISSAQDPRFNWDRIEEGQKLANKLWNVARLMLTDRTGVVPEARPTSIEERWILSELESARAVIEEALAVFQFGTVADALYHLTFDDFCDWYAEAIKPRLYGGDEDAVATALASLERLLQLLHPVMPHVTEEIWSQFHDSRLILGPWPDPQPADAEAAAALDRARAAAATFRRSGVLVPLEGDEKRIFDAVVKPERAKGGGDAEAERERLRKEIARSEGMLGNERFVQNARAEVVAGEREKLERYRRELAVLEG